MHNKQIYQVILKCRICHSKNLKKILDFGSTPLANAFLNSSQLQKKEDTYPLYVNLCLHCFLVQLGIVVSPQILFKDYLYVSSTSIVFQKHFVDFASHVSELFQLSQNDLIIDIGSNDGILLKPFKKLKCRVLGIEPAENVAAIARKNNIDSIAKFFSVPLAMQIATKYGLAKIIAATNVFAHIHDLDEVVIGVKKLLAPNGIFIIEAPYLVDFIEKNLFDTVYHEHLSYLAIYPLKILFEKHEMRIIRVERVTSHGGSIRVFVAPIHSTHQIDTSVTKFLDLEQKLQLHSLKTFIDFAGRVNKNKIELYTLLTKLKKQGKHIAGYGAPAKGNTLLNYFGIDHSIIDFIAEDSQYKQGLFTPGTHISIIKPEKIYEVRPGYLLLLAWNFSESIMKKHMKYKDQGGHFIIPVPKPKII